VAVIRPAFQGVADVSIIEPDPGVFLRDSLARGANAGARSCNHREIKMKTALLVLGVGLAFAPAAWAQDAVGVASKQFKVLAEDDQVRVMEYRDKKGDKVPMHSHPKHIVYILKDSKTKFSFPDGTSKESEVKAGQALIRPAVTHSQESLKDSHAIVIELKR
jgi:quercetin dioxygenase-like cupin family protein